MTSSISEQTVFRSLGRDGAGKRILNSDALYDLGLWILQEERVLESDGNRLLEWGRWEQEVWGKVDETDEFAGLEKNAGYFEGVLPPVCGTAFCAAGQAVNQAGYRLLIGRYGTAEDCVKIEPTGEVDKKGNRLYRDVPGAQSKDIEKQARKILGLTSHEADYLFSGSNSADRMIEVINAICENRGLPVLFPDYDSALIF